MTYRPFYVDNRGNFKVINPDAVIEDEISESCIKFTNETKQPSFFGRLDRLDGYEIMLYKYRYDWKQNG